jgi:hypothetical protein
MYNLQFGESLDKLINGIDPARQWQTIKQLHKMTMNPKQPLKMEMGQGCKEASRSRTMHCCIALAHWLQEESQVKPTNAINEIKDFYSNVTRFLASAYQDGTHVPVVLDTGALSLLMPFLNDFVGPI